MDLRSLIASAPVLRRAWRMVPGPWRVPLLVGGAAVWLYTKLRSEDEAAESAA